MFTNKESNEYLKTLRLILTKIFSTKKWQFLQKSTYEMLKNYNINYNDEYIKYSQSYDVDEIKINLKLLQWYNNSKHKDIFNMLLNDMYLIKNINIQEDLFILINIIIKFNTFSINLYYYNNKSLNSYEYRFYVEDLQSQKKAYLCLFCSSHLLVPIENTSKIILPEIINILDICNIKDISFKSEHFLLFFIEIISFYDSTVKCIYNTPKSFDSTMTLIEFIKLLENF